MARINTQKVLKERFGPQWLEVLRNTINSTPQYRAVNVLGIGMRALTKVIKVTGAQKQLVYTLPGDRLIIERDGNQTVVVDRTDGE